MKLILTIMIFLQGALVSGTIDKINIKGVDVPIIYEKNEALPIISLQLIITNAGSLSDGDNAGLVRFTSSMLGEGTKQKGSIEFADELESKAVSINAHAGTETFVFELSSLKEQFGFGIWMLKDLLADPNFTQKSFEKIQQLTLGGLSSKKSDFDYIANLNLKKIIFKDTPLENSFSGNEKSITKLKLNDVKKFYENHIDLTNMIIVVGGDVSMDEVKVSLKELLEDVKVGKKRELTYYEVNKNTQEKREVKDTKQAYIYFGAPYNLKSNDTDTYKSKVAGFILGEGGFGSRLMEEIRVKRGLAYSAYSRTSISRSNSYFSGHLQTKNESLEEAKSVVISEIKKFVEKGVTQSELDQAKRFLLGSEPLRNETLSQRLNRAFTEYYRGFKLGHSKAQLDLIESLSLDELNEFIKKHDEITNLSFSIVHDGK
ncbi:insulinase family protein [Sulfurospirillum sp.]|nr:insulinase family protein [Sulfurospirillum sp.]